MQSGELRFRLLCELRKTGGRLGAAILKPQWDRARLASALREDGAPADALAALSRRDYLAAHRAFAAHFSSRSTAFPQNAADMRPTAEAIAHEFPDAAADAVRRGASVCDGRYDLLGFKGLELGANPDWHRDAAYDRQSPLLYWASVPYLDSATGDHKVIWELNRHQHWLTLGRAHALSGERRFYDRFTSELASWLVANPPLIGTNWASMLELGLRTLSWLWTLEFFAGAAEDHDRNPWLVDMLLALDRQLTHVEQNLSHYFSPNTHLSGEALALYVGGIALPELKASARRTAAGRDVLVQEATRQVRSDGGHAELSLHYHRYSTDFYLLATVVARRAGDPAARIFEEAASRQARFLRTMTDDHGVRPQIGDDDGGQLFPICGRDPADCRDTLATAAVLLNDPTLAIGRAPEETFWVCGAAAARAMSDTTTRWTSAALPASGYFVSRTARGDQLIFDAGPHGFLNGGHAHADALSCVLSIAGRSVLIDAGTATYTMDGEIRDQFRSTKMHNTVVIDGRSQSTPRGTFHWKTTASAQAPIWRSASDCDYVEGTHDGYAPRRHTRAILAIHGLGWWILDHVLGVGTATVECYWHLHPAWECAIEGGHVARLRAGEVSLALASTAPLRLLPAGTHPLAARSATYGVIEPAPLLIGGAIVSLPATFASFIPAAAELTRQLRIEESTVEAPPGEDWHGRAFRVRWSGGAMVTLAAVELDGIAPRETAAPAARWGTAEVQTDARVATLIDHAAGPSEAILVNGAFVNEHPMHALVSLSRRVPLLRVVPTALAPGMHEVGTGHEPREL